MPICDKCGGTGIVRGFGKNDVGNEDCTNCIGHDPERCPKCLELLDWDPMQEKWYCTQCPWYEGKKEE